MFSATVVENRKVSWPTIADRGAQRVQLGVAHVQAVDQHPAAVDVVEPGDERGQRRLAAAGRADQRHRAARLDRQVDVGQHRPALLVGEGDAVEPDQSRAVGQRPGVRQLDDVALHVQHLEDPLAGGHRPLVLADPHADHPQRHDQQQQVGVDGEEVAQRQIALDHLVAADQQHSGDRQAGQGRHRRHVAGLQPGGPDALPEDPLGAAAEAGGLVLLLGERLDHPHADHVLLGLGGHIGHPLLHLLEDGVADPRVAVGHHHQHRGDGDRDQHQLDVQQRERDQHDHHRQHVLAEEDQAVAEEEPHRLQVDGRP